jgi:hypothetical protein
MIDRGINKKHEARALVVTAKIARQILVIRGQKVMLDADLAALYGVQTRRLNEQVRRNAERFPEDFVFQTSPAEFASLKSQFATSSWGGTRKLPLAFTEHGAIMAAMVLNSPRATEVSVYVVRAFVQLRDTLLTHKELAKRLDELESRLERKLVTHDQAITGTAARPPFSSSRRNRCRNRISVFLTLAGSEGLTSAASTAPLNGGLASTTS